MSTKPKVDGRISALISIAVISGATSVLVALALIGHVRPFQLVIFGLGAIGAALVGGGCAPLMRRWWPIAMVLGPLLYLVASAFFWISAAYFCWTIGSTVVAGPEEGMTLTAISWLPATFAGAAIYVSSTPHGTEDQRVATTWPKGAARAVGAALVVLPFVLQGVPEVLAPRLVQVSTVPVCGDTKAPERMIALNMAVQWVPSSTVEALDWNESETIAIVNGQAITPLKVPPMLPHEHQFHRRYLLEGSSASGRGNTGQTFEHEYRDTLFRALTLGAAPLPETSVRAEVDLCSA
jgi:hypothetical protein